MRYLCPVSVLPAVDDDQRIDQNVAVNDTNSNSSSSSKRDHMFLYVTLHG